MRKLRQRGFGDDEIATAEARLTELGYLDDREAAGELVEMGRRRRRWGRYRLAAELAKRGVDHEVAEEALADVDDDAERALAGEIAAGWRRDEASLARHLARKGFASSVIVAVLRDDGDPGGDSTREAADEV